MKLNHEIIKSGTKLDNVVTGASIVLVMAASAATYLIKGAESGSICNIITNSGGTFGGMKDILLYYGLPVQAYFSTAVAVRRSPNKEVVEASQLEQEATNSAHKYVPPEQKILQQYVLDNNMV